MNRIVNVTRLQMNKRDVSFLVPPIIVGAVLVVSAIISIALQRAGLNPSHPDFAAGARNNLGIVWSLPGFLVYYGVQAVSTTFPFAMALGATRRSYVLGTALAGIITSLYVTVILVVLLLIELATGHWFYNIYVLDNYALGAGNVGILAVTAFLGVLFCTTVGGLFAAVWVRYGNRGPTYLGIALGLLIAILVLIFVPYTMEIVSAFTRAKLAWGTVGLVVLALVGTWLAMRRTAVR
ncbi:MAG: hypothetical protein ACK5LO_02185 [Leucobacter sp.]